MPRKRNVETEAKIAAAATELFCREGYVDTTMAAIAKGAGVAVQTLYLRHGSKAAILSAALDVAIAGDAEPINVTTRGEYSSAMAEPDAAKAISIFASFVRGICDRTHLLYDVIRSAAADPEVALVLEKNRTERAIGIRAFADVLVSRKGFNGQVPAPRVADLIYAQGTEDSYLRFVLDCGWTSDEWEHWLVDTLTAQLLR